MDVNEEANMYIEQCTMPVCTLDYPFGTHLVYTMLNVLPRLRVHVYMQMVILMDFSAVTERLECSFNYLL